MIPQETPFSTLFILLIAISISFLTSLANRLLTNPEKTKTWRKQISEWNKEYREALKQGDKKKLEKVKKREKEILQLQTKMMWQSIKLMLLFFIPLILMWQFLGGVYGVKPIAYFPGVGDTLPLPIFSSSLLWWYLMCSLFFGTVFSHVFGLVEVST